MFQRISIDPGVMCGKPCFKGTRIPIYIILNLMAAGYSIDHILTTYPKLSEQDVLAAISYAGSITEHEESHSLKQVAI